MTWTPIPEAERRVFTPRRRAQGFHSQEHLDAWYRAFDHTNACPAGICGTPGPSAWLEGDASWQPTVRECEEARRLYDEAHEIGEEAAEAECAICPPTQCPGPGHCPGNLEEER